MHILFPQKLDDFKIQTSLDVNRLSRALVLGLDAQKLYSGQQPGPDNRTYTKSFFKAYPEWKDKFIFFSEAESNEETELICTRNLTVGARLVDLGGERVHAAIVEVFAPRYDDLSFEILANTCNLWFYEIQGIIPHKYKDLYKKVCGDKLASFYDRCSNMKNRFVEAPIKQTVETVLAALKRLGHNLKSNSRV